MFRIEPGGPADLAGLKNGDRILSVNNNKVDGFTHEQVSFNAICHKIYLFY